MMKLYKIPEAHSFWYGVLKKLKDGKTLNAVEFFQMGGRGSAKTTSFAVFDILALLHLKNSDIGFTALRASKQASRKHLDDFCKILDDMEIPYTATRSTRMQVKVFNKTINFYGADPKDKSAGKWSGTPRENCKTLFVWLEEAYEFTQDDISGIKGTMRTNGGQTQIIYVYTLNPWTSQNWLVKYILSMCPWRREIMSNENGKGYQISYVPFKEIDGTTKYRVIQYTNWRCNKENLPKEFIRNLKEMWNYNPRLATVSDWGAPGYEEGRIYTHCLHKIQRARIVAGEQYLLAGLDYGWGLDDRAGVTAAVFGTATLENGVDMLAEYTQDNRKHKQDVNVTCLQIVEFYIKCMMEFMRMTNAISPFPLQVRVDNSEIAVIQMLRNIAHQKRVDNWLSFVQCSKQPINDRIEITLWLMGTGRFRMSPNMKLLRSEFENSYYENTEKQKRCNMYDHAINAYEYSIEKILYEFAAPVSVKSSLKRWKEYIK